MNTVTLAEIEALVQEAREDLTAFGKEFDEKAAEISLRLQRLGHSVADWSRRIIEQHASLVALNARLDSLDARLELVEDALDRRVA